MQALVVSTALKPASKTLSAARIALARLRSAGYGVDLADLATEMLPQCDGADCYQDTAVKVMTERARRAPPGRTRSERAFHHLANTP